MDRGSWRAIVPRITRVGHDNALSFSERRFLYWAFKDFLGKKDERNGQCQGRNSTCKHPEEQTFMEF